MRAVIQRCKRADVSVDGKTVGEIEKGITAFFGITDGDDEETIKYMLEKIINLRIFEDENDKLNLSVKDIDGGILIIPNFTLYGDARKGRRPSFCAAAAPQNAEKIFQSLCDAAKLAYNNVAFGIFQADMTVNVRNDGPVTILLDSEKIF